MKLYAFKQHKHNPNRPANVPEEWAWLRVVISEQERDQYESDNWIVLEVDDFQTYLINKNVQGTLRILDLVHEQFRTLHPSKIDFRRHLRPDVYLQKAVTMHPNGRPDKALYTYNGEKIAEIQFVFEADPLNFMRRRTELLSYYKKNDERGEQYPIADDHYDPAVPYHLRIMMEERSEARASIIAEIKAFLNGVLAQFYLPQGWTYPQILEVVGDFWNEYGKDIETWIAVASPRFRDRLAEDSEFEFLGITVAPGVTMKQYVLQKTSY